MRLEVDTRDIERRFGLVLNEVAINMAQEFAEASPVDTGYLKKTFVTPGPRIDYANGIIEFRAADYLDYVLFGTPPHIIRPKNAKALVIPRAAALGGRLVRRDGEWKTKFSFGGTEVIRDVIFAKWVEHPGTEANPFVQEVIERRFQGILENALRRQFR
jgi:hypothetical protein